MGPPGPGAPPAGHAKGSAILAFDLGQTRIKVAAFDLDGCLLALTAGRTTEHRSGDLHWQEPAEWWAEAGRLSRDLLRRVEPGRIAAVSVSGRGNSLVPTDAHGAPLAPSWSDDRHRTQVERLRARVDAQSDGGTSGTVITTGAIRSGHRLVRQVGPLTRYLWLRDTDPELASRVAKLLYGKDWLVFRMCGRATTDPSSGPDAPDFDRAAVAAAGIDPALLPDVVPPWTVAGALGADAARHLGLVPGVPVAVGGHDGICANLGAGAGTPGGYAITLGTNIVVRAVTTAVPPGAARFYGMPPDRHVIGQNGGRAGRSPDWFCDTWLGAPGETDRQAAFQALDAAAGQVPTGADGVRFLPFLGGHSTAAARAHHGAVFTGLQLHHGRGHLYRAVLEGVAFAVRAIWDRVHGWCGEPSSAAFTGSGARSSLWAQLIVDVLGRPVDLIDGAVEARGAAIYAAVAIGAYPDVDTAAAAMVHPTRRLTPDPAASAAYQQLYAEWQRLADGRVPARPAETRPAGPARPQTATPGKEPHP